MDNSKIVHGVLTAAGFEPRDDGARYVRTKDWFSGEVLLFPTPKQGEVSSFHAVITGSAQDLVKMFSGLTPEDVRKAFEAARDECIRVYKNKSHAEVGAAMYALAALASRLDKMAEEKGAAIRE